MRTPADNRKEEKGKYQKASPYAPSQRKVEKRTEMKTYEVEILGINWEEERREHNADNECIEDCSGKIKRLAETTEIEV